MKKKATQKGRRGAGSCTVFAIEDNGGRRSGTDRRHTTFVVFDVEDNGGRRSGIDRRRFTYFDHIPERRERNDRRQAVDRREGVDRRSGKDRRDWSVIQSLS